MIIALLISQNGLIDVQDIDGRAGALVSVKERQWQKHAHRCVCVTVR